MLEHDSHLGLRRRQALAGADEEGNARPAPVLDLEPQRGVRLGRRSVCDAVDREVAVVLPAHVVRRVALDDGAEERRLRVLDRRRLAARGRLHRRRGDDLHEVVDDDVAKRADRVVEVAPVLDAEVLGHRDLDKGDVVPVPDRLEHGVREAEQEDLVEPHLPEVVVDPVQLRLVDGLVQLVGELAGRRKVVAEGLLDDDTPIFRSARAGEAGDDPAEQERRDLEVEDRARRLADGRFDAPVRRLVPEVALDVREALREPLEHRLVERLPGADDRVPRALDQLVDGPVVDGDADDRAVEEAAALEPVQRTEGHHLREVAGDAEDDEHIRPAGSVGHGGDVNAPDAAANHPHRMIRRRGATRLGRRPGLRIDRRRPGPAVDDE